MPMIAVMTVYFNPRAPCGARHGVVYRETGKESIFQSTRPVRGATPWSPVASRPM